MTTATILTLGLVAAAYLWGGIPTAYLVARYATGIDIRGYGSGNVGASNAVVQLGAKTGVAIGLFDMFGKGSLPVLVAALLLDQSLAAQAAVGLAAVAGHNWSPYIGFTGGRGVSVAGGLVLAFAMWQEAVVCAILMVVIGRLLLKETGLLTLLAMAALPLLALIFDRQPEVIAMCGGVAALLVAKRLTANGEPLTAGQPMLRTLFNRMLWDRDVSRRTEWTGRTPPTEEICSNREASADGTDSVLR